MLASEAERSTSGNASNGETHDDEDAQQARLISSRVDPLEEVSVESEESSIGVMDNGSQRSARVREEPRRCSSSDHSKQINLQQRKGKTKFCK